MSTKYSADVSPIQSIRVQQIREQNLKRMDELLASKQAKIAELFNKQNNGTTLSKKDLDLIISLKCEAIILQNDRLDYVKPADDGTSRRGRKRGGKAYREKCEKSSFREELKNRQKSPVRAAAIDAFCANRDRSHSRNDNGTAAGVTDGRRPITYEDMLEMKRQESQLAQTAKPLSTTMNDVKPKDQRPAYRYINMTEKLKLTGSDEWKLPQVRWECTCEAELANRYWPDDKDGWYDGECHIEYIIDRQAWHRFEQNNYLPDDYELYRVQRHKLFALCERKGNTHFRKLRLKNVKEYKKSEEMQQHESKESFAQRVYGLNKSTDRFPTMCKCFARPGQPWFDVECKALTVAEADAQAKYRQQLTPEADADWQRKRQLLHKTLKYKETAWEKRIARLNALSTGAITKAKNQLPKVIIKLPDPGLPVAKPPKTATTTTTSASAAAAAATTVTGSVVNEPWYDDECIQAKQQTDEALLRFSEDASETNRLYYVEKKLSMEILRAKKSLMWTQDNAATATEDKMVPEWYDKECRIAVDAMRTAKIAYETDNSTDNLVVYQIRKKQKDKIMEEKRCSWEIKIKQQNHGNFSSNDRPSNPKISRPNDTVAADTNLYNPFEKDGGANNKQPVRAVYGIGKESAVPNLRSPKDKNVFLPKGQRLPFATTAIASTVDLTENSDNSDDDGMTHNSNLIKCVSDVDYRRHASVGKAATTKQTKWSGSATTTGQSSNRGPPSQRWSNVANNTGEHANRGPNQGGHTFGSNTGPMNRAPNAQGFTNHAPNHGFPTGQQQPMDRAPHPQGFSNNTGAGPYSANHAPNHGFSTGQRPMNRAPNAQGFSNDSSGPYSASNRPHPANNNGQQSMRMYANRDPNQAFPNFGNNTRQPSQQRDPRRAFPDSEQSNQNHSWNAPSSGFGRR